jgi:hypothetical protein
MADYKHAGKDIEDGVIKYSDNSQISFNGDRNWTEYLDYVAEGGGTDPFKTFDEWVEDAISRLWSYHDSLVSVHPEIIDPKASNRLTKSFRKELKGQATTKDKKRLDDNDLIDSWLDDMEVAAEEDGEQWIEDPARTEQELIDFNPAVQVSWPDFPIL